MNLFQTLILGNRDDIEEMSNSSSVVLMNVLKLIDQYDLYGQVAYPKHHKQSEVPDIYRLAAKTKVLNRKNPIIQYDSCCCLLLMVRCETAPSKITTHEPILIPI